MGSWPGRRAGNAVRTTWRAGTAGSVMERLQRLGVAGESVEARERHAHGDIHTGKMGLGTGR